MYRGRHVSGGCKPGECYEPMTHDYWRHRVGEFQRDLESAACKHVNVSLAPRAVTERMARKKKPNDGNPNMPSQKEERHARDPARYPLKENDQLAQQGAANRSWV